MAPSSSNSKELHQLLRPSAVDWSLLPDVLLVDILGRLRTLRDFFAVRAVCRNWRIVATPSADTLASQSPLLVVSCYSHLSESLYDVAANRFYSLRLPWTHPDRYTIACSHSHLITVSDTRSRGKSKLLLWDIFTGAQIRLPKTPEQFSRVLLSARPDSADCLVVMFKKKSDVVQYLNIGDRRWTVVCLPIEIGDMMFSQGELLALSCHMELFVVELMGDSSRVEKLGGGGIVGNALYSNFRLGESDGMMLAVCNYKRNMFDVFLWNSEKMGWEEVRDLGDRALFVGMGTTVVSISATEFGFRKNCVYWISFFKGRLAFSLEDRCSELVKIDNSVLSESQFKVFSWVFPNEF